MLAVFYFAARQGVMGDKMKSLVATLEQQKPKEPPKPPKEEPKPEPNADWNSPSRSRACAGSAGSRPRRAPPVDAPAAVAPPTLDASFFGDGAKAVVEVSDPKLIYKGSIERASASNWERPEER